MGAAICEQLGNKGPQSQELETLGVKPKVQEKEKAWRSNLHVEHVPGTHRPWTLSLALQKKTKVRAKSGVR